jgi:hypothetical protein
MHSNEFLILHDADEAPAPAISEAKPRSRRRPAAGGAGAHARDAPAATDLRILVGSYYGADRDSAREGSSNHAQYKPDARW